MPALGSVWRPCSLACHSAPDAMKPPTANPPPDRASRRGPGGQQAPRTAAAKPVEHGVNDPARVGRSRSSAGAARRDRRFHKGEPRSCQRGLPSQAPFRRAVTNHDQDQASAPEQPSRRRQQVCAAWPVERRPGQGDVVAQHGRGGRQRRAGDRLVRPEERQPPRRPHRHGGDGQRGHKQQSGGAPRPRPPAPPR